MANTRGVFTLQDVRYAQEDDVWVSPEQAFFAGSTATPNVGYVAGGSTPSTVSSVDKMSLADDTTARVPSADLTDVNRALMGLADKSNAYWCGGRYGGPAAFYSGVEKLSYFSDTISRSPGSNLPATQTAAAGTSNELGGYIAGGSTPSNVTTVNKLIFSTDTCFRFPSANLISAENGAAAIGNQTDCYVAGGETPINSTVDKIVFATDTTTRISANVASLRFSAGASGDTAGYVAGGNDGGPVPDRFKSTVVKFTFADETTSTLPSANSLRNPATSSQGVSNSSAGYFAGGQGSPGSTAYSFVTKISFSDDTASNVPSGGNLSATRYSGASASARASNFPTTGYLANTQNLKGQPEAPNAGYFAGGGGPVSRTDKIDFNSDVAGQIPSANLSSVRTLTSGNSSLFAAYFAGGLNPPTYPSTMDKLTYSSETLSAVPGAFLSTGRQGMGSAGTKDVGYFAGGADGGSQYSKVDKTTYASDTTAQVPSAPLTANRYTRAGAGNNRGGYFSGGGPGPKSSTERLDYSSETTALVPTGNLSIARNIVVATGNKDAGYFGGGINPPTYYSNLDKISYSTDLMSRNSFNLIENIYHQSAAGDQQGGYFAGGYTSGTKSSIVKVSYNNDSTYLLPAVFSATRYSMGGTSGRQNDLPQKRPETPTLEVSYTQITTPFTGYFGGGGGPGGKTSNYYKLLFASETGSFLPSTHMSTARSTDLGGYSDSTDGWTMGGYANAPTYLAESNTDRLTYASDTSVAVPGANLPGGGRYGGRQGCSTTAGYFVAGFGSGAFSSTLKMPFSTESQAIAPGAALSSARYYFCGGGGTDKGYFGGGYENSPGTPVTKFDKLVYSTDTMTASPASNLKIENTRSNSKACGDSRSLYFGGASSPATGLLNFGYKIPYNTDTSMLVSGFLFTPRTSAVSTGHELEGYYMGGQIPSPYVQLTTVDKINYATEVCSLVPTASLPEHRGGGSNLGCRNMAASGGGTSNTL